MTWVLGQTGEWEPNWKRAGSSSRVGGVIWTFGGPGAEWATETRKEPTTSFTARDEFNNQIELLWDPNKPGTQLRFDKGDEKGKFITWPDSQLRAAAFDSQGRAWVVGWSGTLPYEHAVVARFDQKSGTWRALTRGALPVDRRDAAANSRAWMWMPRWYLAMLILSLALAAPALLPPLPSRPPSDEQDSVEGRLSSDKPLDPGDRDVLGLTEIALGAPARVR